LTAATTEPPGGLSAIAREVLDGQGGHAVGGDALGLLPTRSPQTVIGLIVKGAKMPNGERLRLEGRKVGSSYFTSRAAIARFLAAQDRFFGAAPESEGTP
jgi:hypothetical protein